jgi:hypothetical protein
MTFRANCHRLIDFAERLEQNHQELKKPNARLTLSGLQLSYELLYLKIFLLWEDFLEQVFIRLLCGFASNGGPEPMVEGLVFCQSFDEAEGIILGGKDFQLWHNPPTILNLTDKFFVADKSYFRDVIAANSAALSDYAAIRHRIAHGQQHARERFDDATMNMAGRRYPGSNAGRFLRDQQAAVPPRNWLAYIADELFDIGHQLC